MKADKSFVEEAVERFNKLCFDGVLPPIPVVLTKARTFLGKVTYKRQRNFFGTLSKPFDFKMRISSLYDISRQEWEDVIIHELIHYYIAFNGIKDTSAHGKAFRRMMAEINSAHGRHITIRYHAPASTPAPAADIAPASVPAPAAGKAPASAPAQLDMNQRQTYKKCKTEK